MTLRWLGTFFAGILLSNALSNTTAFAQFNQFIVFGDSNVDSGFYRALPNPGGGNGYNALWPAAVAAGAGAPTSRPGLMNSEMLASYFGLTAAPSNTPGGTNYASSGAKSVDVNTSANGGFAQAVPTTTQISNYLSANSGNANPSAIYLINSGANDVSFANGDAGTGPYPADPTAYLTARAQGLATAIASLKSAGAQTIMVATLAQSYPTNDATARALKVTFNQALSNSLAAQNVSVIKSDTNVFRQAISANPAQFGFDQIGNTLGTTACVKPGNIPTAWALLCSSASGAPSGFASPNADMTRLFSDDQHFATAGQKILANYNYDLLPKPPTSPLVSAVLPASRSVQVGSPATAFATIINSGTSALSNCQFSPVTNVNGRFSYQTTNSQNQLTGTKNTPVSIPANSAQSFLLAFDATAAFLSTDVKFAYVCAGAAAALPIVGINTAKLVFDNNPVPDLIAVGLTPSRDGYVRTGTPTGSGVFVIASINIGIASSVTARPRVTGTDVPLTVTVCQTNPDSSCKATPTATVTATIGTNESTTWGVFAQASGVIAPDPAKYRIFFEFVDAGGVVRGSTSTAVTTSP